MQTFLEIQSQLLQGMATQMTNMGDNSSKGVCDNKDDKDAILEGTQASNTCEDKDHASKEHEDQCPKKRERFPTFEVRYEEHELEELLALERPKKKKKKKCPNPNKEDITQVQCYNCKEMGHYANECPEKKKNQGNKQKAMIPKEKKDISQVMCFKCKELGHYADKCPEKLHQNTKQAKM